jgi:adenine-specific DNA-methyltransferase
MGAYFTVRKARTPSLFDPERQFDAKKILRAGRLMARSIAMSFEEREREAFARTFTTAVVSAYWNGIQQVEEAAMPIQGLLLHQRVLRLSGTAESLASSMGDAASALDPLAAAYLISATYTATLPDAIRSKLGAYYTPPPIADRLVTMAARAGINWATCRVLDPACGGGAFLSAVAIPMLSALPNLTPQGRLEEIELRLKGFEIDPYAAWLSQVFLEATVLPLCRRADRRLSLVVEVRDALNLSQRKQYDEHFDLVIGNPPYGKVTLSPAERKQFERSLYGHANLYGLFTDLAISFARNGGIIAYVTPTSFLSGEYFKSLRALLTKTARPVNIDFVSLRKGVFDDALQETLLATYRKAGVYLYPPTVHFLKPTDEDTVTTEAGGTFDLPNGGGPWLAPRSLEQARLLTRLREMSHRLKDYGYEVSTGPLVWNRHKSQLTPKRGAATVPLIWAESVTADGRFRFRAEKRNHEPYFRLKKDDEWLITRKPCVLLQRTTATEQSRRLIAAELPSEFLKKHGPVVVENHLNMIRSFTGKPAVSARILARILNSAVVDRAFRCISGSVAVSAYELENLPLPDPKELLCLLRRSTGENAIERICSALYSPDGGL